MKLKNLFASDTSNVFPEEETCCGRHEICRKNRQAQPVQSVVDYYDDEELDVFKNRSSDSYTPEEQEQFTEIIQTMKSSDMQGWLHSLQLRGIALPDSLAE